MPLIMIFCTISDKLARGNTLFSLNVYIGEEGGYKYNE